MGEEACRHQGCIRREGTSEVAPGAVRSAVGGGCQSGWGQLLSLTNAIEPGTAVGEAGCPGGGRGTPPPFQCIPGPWGRRGPAGTPPPSPLGLRLKRGVWGGRGSGTQKSLCTTNGPKKFILQQMSLFPTLKILVRGWGLAQGLGIRLFACGLLPFARGGGGAEGLLTRSSSTLPVRVHVCVSVSVCCAFCAGALTANVDMWGRGVPPPPPRVVLSF